jgi:hypothetical protein
MFDVVEAYHDEPIRFFADPDAKFRPGFVCQLKDLGDNIVCTLSDGTRPFGIVSDFKVASNLGFSPRDIVRVWTQRMIFRTDEFDDQAVYTEGCPLYISDYGIFTSAKKEGVDKPIVARMITPASESSPYFEALWL